MPSSELQAIASIPPLDFQDYPIDVHIRVYRTGAFYAADILTMGQMRRITIEMSPHDLKSLNSDMQNAMRAVASTDGFGKEKTTIEAVNRLFTLAEIGHYAFKRIFGTSAARAIVQDLLAPSQRASIQVASEDFFIPWDIIYPASLDVPPSLEHFWGMAHIISRTVIQDSNTGAFVSPAIPTGLKPKIGLLTYLSLPSVKDREVPFFESLNTDGKISLARLRALNPENKREELREFRAFWNNTLDVAHFACHAFFDDRSPDLSRILITDEFPISIRDMETCDLSITGHPLIVLNACETGNLNPLYTSYFAAAFLKYGARGVLATECAIPDSFAADFAEQLYQRLLAGEQLGESLLNIRRHFWNTCHNLSGLLYSMYAPPSIRFTHKGDHND